MSDDKRHFLLLVRRSPTHSVVAHVQKQSVHQNFYKGLRVRLLRVSPDAGPCPSEKELADLIGGTFTKGALRRAILNKMRKSDHEHEHSDNHSPQAVKRTPPALG